MDEKDVKAKFENGVLTLAFPKEKEKLLGLNKIVIPNKDDSQLNII